MNSKTTLTTEIFSELCKILYKKTGILVAENRNDFFESRMFTLMNEFGIDTWQELVDRLKRHDEKKLHEVFVNALTTNKTHFFRENEHFEYIQNEVLPKFKQSKDFVAWCGAASTGEEPYTLAVVVDNYFNSMRTKPKIKILATDIDSKVLDTCEKGIYLKRKVGDAATNPMLKKHLFEGKGANAGKYKLSEKIVKSVKFRQLNLVDTTSYPKIKCDLIILRNVLIYFDEATVKKIVNSMRDRLKPDGVLILGFSEALAFDVDGLTYCGKSIYKKDIKSYEITEDPVQKLKVVSEDEMVKKKVLIVDDSKSIQKLLNKMLSKDSAIEVVGTADNALMAEEMIKELKPGVITLDVQMPGMNGIEFLEKKIPNLDISVVMVSSLGKNDSSYYMKSLDFGAFDYIEKPTMENIDQVTEHLCRCVKIASKSNDLIRLRKRVNTTRKSLVLSEEVLANKIIAIGSSTGGVVALKDLFDGFPDHIPPTVVVQHIPQYFSAKLAERFDNTFSFKVKEAADGDKLENNTVYIAAGGTQLKIKRRGSDYYLRVTDDAPVNRHKPSVDYFFDSLVSEMTSEVDVYAAILTGMGGDGAKGLLSLKKQGATTFAQDEKSCVVFGMPRVAIKLGAAQHILPLTTIPEKLFELMNKSKKSA